MSGAAISGGFGFIPLWGELPDGTNLKNVMKTLENMPRGRNFRSCTEIFRKERML